MNKQPIKDGKGAGIEWPHIHGRPGFTANPVRGCLHDCEWRMPDGTIVACYAKEFRERLDGPGSFEKLTWHPDVLEDMTTAQREEALLNRERRQGGDRW